MSRYVACKHPTKHKRYSIKNTGAKLSWITSPTQTFGSYRLKRDASKRADELNTCEAQQREGN